VDMTQRSVYAECQRDQKALTRGRTDDFSNIIVDRQFSAGCYLFTVSKSDLLFNHGAAAGFYHFHF